jgi:hypothetical protein
MGIFRMPSAVCRNLGNCNWANFFVAEDEGPILSLDIERSAEAGDCQYCSMLYRRIAYLCPDNRPESFYFWKEDGSSNAFWFAPIDLSAVYELHTEPSTYSPVRGGFFPCLPGAYLPIH